MYAEPVPTSGNPTPLNIQDAIDKSSTLSKNESTPTNTNRAQTRANNTLIVRKVRNDVGIGGVVNDTHAFAHGPVLDDTMTTCLESEESQKTYTCLESRNSQCKLWGHRSWSVPRL